MKTLLTGLTVAVAVLMAAGPSTAAGLNASLSNFGRTVQLEGSGGRLVPVNNHHWGEPEPRRHWDDRLRPDQIRRILRRQGFSHIEIVDRGRRTYTVLAENYRGRDRLLIVHAYSGHILENRRAGRGHGRML